ncbi:leucine-rich repeats and guanylate kinase domain containing [Thecamonas trahens ATCC 50062]|uniref:Leucine-rich repeats and guanylate kinase domain containing n=1 Tax=Thecamonas trahens ATCC 50062 TaxID=461836 RepID=A0A0L0DEI4_THETB|nr:leucine-rich repeats and guanylate kinase domain containing [Thecamonas trahens ATCC 50062]KNC49738.1 leucine-rich repeats and guanylate kinase domain containing [Thecamonas trahens ATCC 50062]|eukprot:XP_013757525.1 leucine-rich repeats and guanylate kinase domain containing [Thecamonas trahens ATCC 50062]
MGSAEPVTSAIAAKVTARLSQLGRTADGTRVAYLALHAPSLGVTSAKVLSEYPHLEELDLHDNALVDLAPLSPLAALLTLDVSGNGLANLLDFAPPAGLRVVNYASNALERLPPTLAADHPCLTTLILDHNGIADLSPLAGLQSLVSLSVRHNKVDDVSVLTDLPALKELALSGNHLQSLVGLAALPALERLDVANNAITTLDGFESELEFLFEVDAGGNFIKDVEQVAHLAPLPLLRKVTLAGNPMAADEGYRTRTLFLVPQLAYLDGGEVSAEDKVAVVNMYDPPQPVLDYRKHCLEYDTMLGEHLSLPPPLADPDLEAPAIWDGEIRVGSPSSRGSTP